MAVVAPYVNLAYRVWPSIRQPRAADRRLVEQVLDREAEYAGLSDEELKQRYQQLKSRVGPETPVLDTTVVRDTFCLVREASARTLGVRHYQVQVLAGLVTAAGGVAEMQTGEGKTLTALLPAALHALSASGVHVATVNAYLASRDFEQLRPVFELLGITVGLADESQSPDEKRKAYACDVTYATGYELGFDYLRDRLLVEAPRRLGQRVLAKLDPGLGLSRPEPVQRDLAFCLIDEADSVLIDEAATPLAIVGPEKAAAVAARVYEIADDVAKQLKPGVDFIVDPAAGSVALTPNGFLISQKAYQEAREHLRRSWVEYVQQALHARHVMRRDSDYVVVDGKIRIVDVNTGRVFDQRKWRDGLHQAIEIKEGVAVSSEHATTASISRQRFFGRYGQVAGMTGTATDCEQELMESYGVPVVSIPTRTPSSRTEWPTRYFASKEQKLYAITREIVGQVEKGRPVLAAAPSIEASRAIAQKLDHISLAYRLLDGVQDHDEAALISTAGEPGVVTIATNMAGRGADIPSPSNSQLVGGLHVIGSERHSCRRVDRQLAGRTGRQGQKGSFRYFVSAEDSLLGEDRGGFADQLRRISGPEGVESRGWDLQVRNLQRQAEQSAERSRRTLSHQESMLSQLAGSVA